VVDRKRASEGQTTLNRERPLQAILCGLRGGRSAGVITPEPKRPVFACFEIRCPRQPRYLGTTRKNAATSVPARKGVNTSNHPGTRGLSGAAVCRALARDRTLSSPLLATSTRLMNPRILEIFNILFCSIPRAPTTVVVGEFGFVSFLARVVLGSPNTSKGFR